MDHKVVVEKMMTAGKMARQYDDKIEWINKGDFLCSIAFEYHTSDWRIEVFKPVSGTKLLPIPFPNSKAAKVYASEVLFPHKIEGWKENFRFNWFRIKDTPIWLVGGPENWEIESDEEQWDWFDNWLETHRQSLYVDGQSAKTRRILLKSFLQTQEKFPHPEISKFMQKFYQ